MDRNKKNRARPVRHNLSGVGFLLLDSSFTPIYANEDAFQILTYPSNPRYVGFFDGLLAKTIQSALFNGDLLQPPTEFLSGRRHYSCRVFSADSNSKNPAHATTVLFERRPRRPGDLAQIAVEFNLTERERETVEFLLQGLTSKEIAGRMGISPNTVKAFLRFIMIKMDVTTRSGILGKIVKTRLEV